jgi:hypothetical protein
MRRLKPLLESNDSLLNPAGLIDLRDFFIPKRTRTHPCALDFFFGRIRHALQFRPLFSEPRANFVVTPI